MTINKALLALAIGLALASCTSSQSSAPTPQTIAQQQGVITSGLERSIERFSKPDEYGVMCYQDRYSSRNLSCVQVTDAKPTAN
jgi:hypothetical protein